MKETPKLTLRSAGQLNILEGTQLHSSYRDTPFIFFYTLLDSSFNKESVEEF